jgi:hypothetical protein
MTCKNLFAVTAVAETGTGILLLFLPAAVCSILLGIESPLSETVLISRFAGTALVAIGVACWLARSDSGNGAQRGLLIGVLIYYVVAAGLLAYAGLVLSLVGIALWPAVGIHVALALWCLACLRS